MKINPRRVTDKIIQQIHRMHENDESYNDIAEVIGFSTWIVGEVLRNNVQTAKEYYSRNSKNDAEPEQVVLQLDDENESNQSVSVVEALDNIAKLLDRIADKLDDCHVRII